jgi:hypothetical protein
VRGRSIDLAALLVVLAGAAAGCGGGGPKTDADAVAQTLKDTASAVSKGDGEKTCGHLTPDAQRQAALQVGAAQAFGDVDCATMVNRATVFLTPLDRKQIKSLAPSNVQVNGASASATLASSPVTAQGQAISVQLNLQKVGQDWKISGFSNAVGLPGD